MKIKLILKVINIRISWTPNNFNIISIKKRGPISTINLDK